MAKVWGKSVNFEQVKIKFEFKTQNHELKVSSFEIISHIYGAKVEILIKKKSNFE